MVLTLTFEKELNKNIILNLLFEGEKKIEKSYFYDYFLA